MCLRVTRRRIRRGRVGNESSGTDIVRRKLSYGVVGNVSKYLGHVVSNEEKFVCTVVSRLFEEESTVKIGF